MCGREGDTTVVEFEKSVEIQEMALGRLGTEISVKSQIVWTLRVSNVDDLPRVLTSGTDAASEHEVKLLGFRDLVSSGGVFNFVLSTQLPQFRPGIVIKLVSGLR